MRFIAASGPQIDRAWTDNSTNEESSQLDRSTNNTGFVLGVCVNDGWGSQPAPSVVSSNADQTLFPAALVDNNCGHFHTCGNVPTAGPHTDVHGKPFDRNAYEALAFESAVAASPVSPIISSVGLIGSDLVFAGTNGAPSARYCVLSSTSLMLPVDRWPRVATNQILGNGSFSFTHTVEVLEIQRFHRSQLP